MKIKFWNNLVIITMLSVALSGCVFIDKNVNTDNIPVQQTGKEDSKELQEKIEQLEKEKAELEKKVQNNMDIQAKDDKHNQIMNELTEIYNLITEEKKSEAAERLNMIDTIGFDDGELAFYETLKIIVND